MFFYMRIVSLMCQSDVPSIFRLGKLAFLNAACVFLYFCGVSKNNICGYNFIALFIKVNMCNF